MRYRLSFPARSIVFASAFAFALCLVALPARAVSLIRDADIEYSLMQLAAPILRAAGLGPNSVKILLIDDRSLNAFVIDRSAIYIHTGMLTRLKRAEALQSVIAHEAAHIANGHIARRQIGMGSVKTASGLGIALALASAASGVQGGASAALALGVASSARRNLLGHTRSEESSADQSAVRYMAAAGISTRGAIEVHDIFEGQDVLSDARQDPYARSHPFSRDRVRAMKAYVAAYGGDLPYSAQYAYWFERAKSKVWAFQQNPKSTERRAARAPSRDIALMMQAIAHHRRSQTAKAVQIMSALIALRPKDVFYQELLGQILLEGRQFSAAAGAYKRASQLAPRNALILGGYGRALLAAGQPKTALDVLNKARQRDTFDARILQDLGTAYAQTGQRAMASLMAAERQALNGRFKDAEHHAKRAAAGLPNGSGAWQRAQDVLIAAQRMNN